MMLGNSMNFNRESLITPYHTVFYVSLNLIDSYNKKGEHHSRYSPSLLNLDMNGFQSLQIKQNAISHNKLL